MQQKQHSLRNASSSRFTQYNVLQRKKRREATQRSAWQREQRPRAA